MCYLDKLNVAIIIESGDFSSQGWLSQLRANVDIYKSSTLSLAHWVLRKNFSDDLIDGSLLKQLILIR